MRIERWYWLPLFCVVSLVLHFTVVLVTRGLGLGRPHDRLRLAVETGLLCRTRFHRLCDLDLAHRCGRSSPMPTSQLSNSKEQSKAGRLRRDALSNQGSPF